jgi:hypothetical protein
MPTKSLPPAKAGVGIHIFPDTLNKIRRRRASPAMTMQHEQRLEPRHSVRHRPYPAFPNVSGLVTRTGLPSRKASAFSTLCG